MQPLLFDRTCPVSTKAFNRCYGWRPNKWSVQFAKSFVEGLQERTVCGPRSGCRRCQWYTRDSNQYQLSRRKQMFSWFPCKTFMLVECDNSNLWFSIVALSGEKDIPAILHQQHECQVPAGLGRVKLLYYERCFYPSLHIWKMLFVQNNLWNDTVSA